MDTPYAVDRPYRVEVAKPYPVHVDKPYPVEVVKEVAQPYPVHVDKPYPVEVVKHVAQPYPVYVQRTVVQTQQPVHVHKSIVSQTVVAAEHHAPQPAAFNGYN